MFEEKQESQNSLTKEPTKSVEIHANIPKFCKIIRGDVLIRQICQICQILETLANFWNSFEILVNSLKFQILVFPDVLVAEIAQEFWIPNPCSACQKILKRRA